MAEKVESGTRKQPLDFQSLEQAKACSVKHFLMIWAKLWRWTSVFQIYPGGRTIHWR
jgi:hypothetical protein